MDRFYAIITRPIEAMVDNRKARRWAMLGFVLLGIALLASPLWGFFGLAWGMATMLTMIDIRDWDDRRGKQSDDPG